MKHLLLIPCLALLLSFNANAQTFCIAVGGALDDVAWSLVQTSDDGYAIAGITYSFGAGNMDAYIVKLNSTGALQWTRTIGGAFTEEIRSLVQTSDGGYAMAGRTQTFGAGAYDCYIVKLDSTGALQWTRTMGGVQNDWARSIVQTSDGGYAIAGYTNSFGAGSWDYYIVKLDSAGTLQWTRTVGGTNNDWARSIVQTSDGGYAIAGSTQSFGAGSDDYYIVKLNSSGTLQWTRTVGGAGSDRAFSIVQTSDGGYAIAGETDSFGAGSRDFYIVKLDSTGALQWTRTVGGANADRGFSMVQTNDGGYAIAGVTTSFGAGDNDFYIVKLDSTGALQWTRTVGGTNVEYAWSLVQTSDGGYAIAGRTQSFGAGNMDAYIVKLDANGNTCCSSGSGGTSSTGGVSGSGGTSGTGGITGSGGTSGSGGILIVDCNTVGIEPLSPVVSSSILNVHPNPTTGVFTVQGVGTISVFDLLGNLLLTEPVNRQVDLSAFPNGIYVIKVDSTTIKLILTND